MSACGVDDSPSRTVKLFASHQTLVLDYERELPRLESQRLYLLSAHQTGSVSARVSSTGADVALGDHRQPGGVKIGPTVAPDQAVAPAQRLDPDDVTAG